MLKTSNTTIHLFFLDTVLICTKKLIKSTKFSNSIVKLSVITAVHKMHHYSALSLRSLCTLNATE